MTPDLTLLHRILQARGMNMKDFFTIHKAATVLAVQPKRIQRLITNGALNALRTSPSKYDGGFAEDLEAYFVKVKGDHPTNSEPAPVSIVMPNFHAQRNIEAKDFTFEF
jgi:hypothetical protein